MSLDNIECDFSLLEPEFPDAIVPTPQVLTFSLDVKTRLVYVYFMTNTAESIIDGFATSGSGALNLWYTPAKRDSVCMSSRLNKVLYKFPDCQGMASKAVFCGERKRRKK